MRLISRELEQEIEEFFYLCDDLPAAVDLLCDWINQRGMTEMDIRFARTYFAFVIVMLIGKYAAGETSEAEIRALIDKVKKKTGGL